MINKVVAMINKSKNTNLKRSKSKSQGGGKHPDSKGENNSKRRNFPSATGAVDTHACIYKDNTHTLYTI